MAIDVLFINDSNLPEQPVYPYGLVQASAVARRYGLKVEVVDLFGLSSRAAERMVRRELERHRPRAVGIHLRQMDSAFSRDYLPMGEGGLGGPNRGYFPVLRTLALVRKLREWRSPPILLGGYGFSTCPEKLFELLAPDFGVQGEPDGVFRSFDRLLQGKGLGSIPNLVHGHPRRPLLNPRREFGPLDRAEYDPETVERMVRFYGLRGLHGGEAAPHVAVEVSRGCCFRCAFCTEPFVKGSRVRVRDLDVVMEDVRLLRQHGLGKLWMVCSELNLGGDDLLCSLAERMRKENEQPGPLRVTWSAYLLPGPTPPPDELELLMESGFVPGWLEVLSYDDENLRANRVPYRAREAFEWCEAWTLALKAQAERRGLPYTNPVSVFLGNVHTTARTIRKTVSWAARGTHHREAREANVVPATRLFELGGRWMDGKSDGAYSVGPEGRLSRLDPTFPTFQPPQKLLHALGSEAEVNAFLDFVRETFLSCAHRERKNWASFLRAHVPPRRLAGWLLQAQKEMSVDVDSEGGAPELTRHLLQKALLGDFDELYHPLPDRAREANQAAGLVLQVVLAFASDERRRVLRWLRLPIDDAGECSLPEYRLMAELSSRYASSEELVKACRRGLHLAPKSIAEVALWHFLYDQNVVFRRDYVALLFGRRQPARRRVG